VTWELIVTRTGCHSHLGRVRTFGSYDVLVDGKPAPGLCGHTVEAPGPGDNGLGGRNRSRVAAGRYPLSRHLAASYRTADFDIPFDDEGCLPGIEFLLPEGVRSDLLIRPAHPPRPTVPGSNLWLSSIGCINPTHFLTDSAAADFQDSCERVVALIASLRDRLGEAFERAGPGEPLAGAFVEIRGEP
jgi:hypothetical protein